MAPPHAGEVADCVECGRPIRTSRAHTCSERCARTHLVRLRRPTAAWALALWREGVAALMRGDYEAVRRIEAAAAVAADRRPKASGQARRPTDFPDSPR